MRAGGEGLPVCAILDNVGMHGPYYGASSPEVGGVEEDVFGFGGGKSSDAIGQCQERDFLAVLFTIITHASTTHAITHTHACTRTFPYTHMHAHVLSHTHTCMHTHYSTHAHTYKRAHTHTHIHT